jgi:hypothetical protein
MSLTINNDEQSTIVRCWTRYSKKWKVYMTDMDYKKLYAIVLKIILQETPDEM